MNWSIAGKTVLISGATSGIGLESAAVLASQGASVILVGRDGGRVEKARAVVRARAGVEPASYLCDFADLSAVRRLADDVLRDVPALHVLRGAWPAHPSHQTPCIQAAWPPTSGPARHAGPSHSSRIG